jgi:hypothetical protein
MSELDDMLSFKGFEPPRGNYSKLPHALIDQLPLIDNMAELKVVLYTLRHTWGFSEYGKPKRITLDEFMHGRKKADGTRLDFGTGLAESSVTLGLEKAVKHGFLVVLIDDSDMARRKRWYGLNMLSVGDEADAPDIQIPESRGSDPEIQGAAPRQSGVDQRKKPLKEKITLTVENAIFAGEPVTPDERALLKQSIQDEFKINPNWNESRTKNRSFVADDLLTFLMAENVTPEMVAWAAEVWRNDNRFNGMSPYVSTIYHNWPQLIENFGKEDAPDPRITFH